MHVLNELNYLIVNSGLLWDSASVIWLLYKRDVHQPISRAYLPTSTLFIILCLWVAAANLHIKRGKSAYGRHVVALLIFEALSFIRNSHKYVRYDMRVRFMSMNCTAKLPFSPRASIYLFKSSICLITCCWDCITTSHLDKEIHTNPDITAWEDWEHPGKNSELVCHSTMWKQKNHVVDSHWNVEVYIFQTICSVLFSGIHSTWNNSCFEMVIYIYFFKPGHIIKIIWPGTLTCVL